ncbi:MAG: hypothetical protein UR89_C0011G0005 [Candidatus Roizmanbacteria bacterium GW2011_GWA2_35_8]|uniref:Glycosyltransferase RgtA/B/C/D-like domain-containing protein n=1 Tax=Candidatus Roizmanbacteria bacterium GW2011_GWA2_35_8 TaxID=1618479 RepID=A0A0G0G577_9BACT|nr:MAG: hypothetical protein UR89_C0011G0005 [Candidatus Roizmanbacteria bacterium GW2011_GWA2_35_8]
MSNYLKKTAITFLILFSLFIFGLFLASLIPSSLLKTNITQSLVTLKNEGTYPSIGPVWRSIVLDNYTDPLILNTAYSVDSTDSLKSSLLNYRYMESSNQFNQIINLEKTVLDRAPFKVAYERYWHGYLVYLRPLLSLFSYNQIRLIISFFLYSSFIGLSIMIWKKTGLLKALIFIVSLLAVDFFHIGKSIQFSNVFLVGIFSSICLLTIYKKRFDTFNIFFIAGALTSFFDLLTTPLISLGILLVTEAFLEDSHWIRVIKNSFFWSVGYLSLWASKWLIVTFFYAPGSIFTSFDQVINRTIVKPDPNFSYLRTLQLNVFQMIGYHKSNKIFFLLIFLIAIFFVIKFFKIDSRVIKKIIPWILIGVIPYLWYMIAANHSYLHCWYTYRNQFMSIAAGFMIVYELTNVRFKKPASNRNDKRLNKIN